LGIRVTHIAEWVGIVFIGWVVVSALAAPFIGRFLGDSLSDPGGETTAGKVPAPVHVRHDVAEA
jgi:hypothetical protein